MAAAATRMLVLGVACMFEPANGYQLRRELVSWRVEHWANVKPGSIYSMLATLTKQGMLESHSLPEGARTVTVYTATPRGQAELRRLLHEGFVQVSAMDPLLFRVAFGFTPLLDRETFIDWLQKRSAALEQGARELHDEAQRIAVTSYAPPHVGHSFTLEGQLLETAGRWVGELLAAVRGGALHFAGEAESWRPPDDDAAWKMAEESRRYRGQLAELKRQRN